MNPYWWIKRHWWQYRQRRFVKDIQFYLGKYDRLYVHPKLGGPATILVTPYDPTSDHNYTHVEGNK